MKKLKDDVLHNIMLRFEETIAAYVNKDYKLLESYLVCSIYSDTTEIYKEDADEAPVVQPDGTFNYKGKQFYVLSPDSVTDDRHVIFDDSTEMSKFVTWVWGPPLDAEGKVASNILKIIDNYLETGNVHA